MSLDSLVSRRSRYSHIVSPSFTFLILLISIACQPAESFSLSDIPGASTLRSTYRSIKSGVRDLWHPPCGWAAHPLLKRGGVSIEEVLSDKICGQPLALRALDLRLHPLREGTGPKVISLHGAPGTGKTMFLSLIIDPDAAQSRGSSHRSSGRIAGIFSESGSPSTRNLYERIKGVLTSCPTSIIILDEAHMFPREDLDRIANEMMEPTGSDAPLSRNAMFILASNIGMKEIEKKLQDWPKSVRRSRLTGDDKWIGRISELEMAVLREIRNRKAMYDIVRERQLVNIAEGQEGEGKMHGEKLHDKARTGLPTKEGSPLSNKVNSDDRDKQTGKGKEDKITTVVKQGPTKGEVSSNNRDGNSTSKDKAIEIDGSKSLYNEITRKGMALIVPFLPHDVRTAMCAARAYFARNLSPERMRGVNQVYVDALYLHDELIAKSIVRSHPTKPRGKDVKDGQKDRGRSIERLQKSDATKISGTNIGKDDPIPSDHDDYNANDDEDASPDVRRMEQKLSLLAASLERFARKRDSTKPISAPIPAQSSSLSHTPPPMNILVLSSVDRIQRTSRPPSQKTDLSPSFIRMYSDCGPSCCLFGGYVHIDLRSELERYEENEQRATYKALLHLEEQKRGLLQRESDASSKPLGTGRQHTKAEL